MAAGSAMFATCCAPHRQLVAPASTCRPLCFKLSSCAGTLPRGAAGRRCITSICRNNTLVVCSATTLELPNELRKMVGAFQMVTDPKAKYQQLLFLAKKLQPLPAEEHNELNKVPGCVSQVWMVADLKDDGKLYWNADSDSALTKGLAALLVQGLSGCAPAEIVKLDPGFIEAMGLKQALTPSRNNGFLNMFKLMQRKSLELLLKQKDDIAETSDVAASAAAGSTTSAVEYETQQAADAEMGRSLSDSGPTPGSNGTSSNGRAADSGGASSSSTPVRDSMHRKLTQALSPVMLLIEDESSQHAGHAGVRELGKAGSSGETHFRIDIVSGQFEGLNAVKRHRLVYQVLQEELAGSVHALSLVTKSPSET